MPGPRGTAPAPNPLATGTRGAGAQPAAPAQPALQPTPEQQAAAAEQARLNNQRAVWDPKTGSYRYVPLSAGEIAQRMVTAPPPGTPAPTPTIQPGASTQPVQGINPYQPQSVEQRLQSSGGPGYAPLNTTGVSRASGTAPQTGTQQAVNAMRMPDPTAVPGRDPNASPGFATTDYSRYDQAASAYGRAEQTFLSELDRLSGVDPFGNQAFLKKATDRAVAQARGTAAMQRGGAAAQAGALRGAVGVQSQLAARGAEEQAIQRSRDEVASGQLRGQAAAGLAGVAAQRAGNEVELAKLQTETMSQNLNAWLNKYGVDRQLAQSDVENLRQVALEYQRLAEAGEQADAALLMQKYGIDEQTRVAMEQIAAGENLSAGDWLLGTLGAVSGIGMGIATAPSTSVIGKALSDRRAKFAVADTDLRDLQDFLGVTKAKSYRYRSPEKTPGAKAGPQFGFMAQDLAKSKIGRTLVKERPDGLLEVDATGLAMADHAALAELARDVEKLKRRGGGSK